MKDECINYYINTATRYPRLQSKCIAHPAVITPFANTVATSTCSCRSSPAKYNHCEFFGRRPSPSIATFNSIFLRLIMGSLDLN